MQKGFTLMELLMLLMIAAGIGMCGLVCWAVVHFVSKYW